MSTLTDRVTTLQIQMHTLEGEFRDAIVDLAEGLTDDPLWVPQRPRGLHSLFVAARGRAPRPPRPRRPI